jgi:hypothetical protein
MKTVIEGKVLPLPLPLGSGTSRSFEVHRKLVLPLAKLAPVIAIAKRGCSY